MESNVIGPLPSGRHNLPREFVVSSQRDRVLDAMAKVCAEKGYTNVTVADIVEAAHVSRSTFYELFRDKETCFLAAFDAILSSFLTDLIRACESEGLSWAERVRAGLEVMLAFFSAEPAFGRMCMVDMPFAGQRAIDRYNTAIRVIATYVDRGREETPDGDSLPNSLPSAIVGGGAMLIREEILAGRAAEVKGLMPDLLYLTLSPYLGREEALRHARESRAVVPLRAAG